MINSLLSQYLVLRLADVRVAVSTSEIEVVLPIDPKQVCPIPGVSQFLIGVVNYSGQLLWVLQLNQLLGLVGETSSSDVLTSVVIAPRNQQNWENSNQNLIVRAACIVDGLEGIISSEDNTSLSFPQINIQNDKDYWKHFRFFDVSQLPDIAIKNESTTHLSQWFPKQA